MSLISGISRYIFYAFMLMNFCMSIVSVVLYLARSEGSIIYFNGTPSPTAIHWIRVVASGDLLVAFLCFKAITTRSNSIARLILQSNFIYSVFHVGAFYHGHISIQAHPEQLASGYLPSISIALIALLYWGYVYPPHDKDDLTIKKSN